MPTKDLVGDVARKASLLARKEVELAKAELRDDLRREVRLLGGFGVAGICAFLAAELLLAAIVLAIALALPGWAAALITAAGVVAIGAVVGLWGWARRVREPLHTSRRSLKEDVRWAREQIG
jgi:uncharacterized membrane protein YqjE